MNYYLKFREEKIKKLEKEKEQLRANIENIKKVFSKKEEQLLKLKKEEETLESKYYLLMDMMKNQGAIFTVKNRNYRIKEWDNLDFIKDKSNYILVSKSGETIHTFDKNETQMIDTIIKHNDYSVVVIRVDALNIKIQFRIKQHNS